MSDAMVRKKLGDGKQVLQEHQESEYLYRSLFECNPDAVYALDLDGYFISGNSVCEEIFGYRMEELLQTSLLPILDPKSATKTAYHLKMAVEGELQEYETTIIHKNGSPIQVQIKNFPILVDEEVVGVYGIVRDIMARKYAEEDLRNKEEQYRRLVEHSPETVIICRNSQLIYSNQAGLTLIGAESLDEIVGRPVLDFIHTDYHSIATQQFHQVESNEKVELIEQKFIRLDGKIIDVEVKGIATYFENEPAIHVIVRDITEQKRTQELLQNSEKLTLVGQLAAGIAHEIRNPLTALKGFLQLMQSGGVEKQEYFSIMRSELTRIELIVSELLVLAKPHATFFQERDLRMLINHVVTLLDTEAIIKNVQIITYFDTEIPFIRCDENQLKQAFINFLKNGIEAMPFGGEIFIRVIRRDDKVVVHFEDNGSGISEEQIPKLGEPFFTTKVSGTGLGLMISNRIIQNHQGDVQLSSRIGEGTTVEVTLPIHT